ncbi:MAG: NAD-dependent succinate-semialdehyde dehydrogenase [Desulfobacteraceae bacterium]|nr:NAD-dependent succinate-semialdehyde dehydrogenase [Desulfobacteraceae bacterium]MBC2750777.1 NAD-dependent succinate-semialdehyde dehydrogenase [Desulfobacteraceae bacterium]
MKLMDNELLRQKAWIDGQWVEAQSGKTLTVTNPADGTILGTVPSLSQDETIQAINAAEKALPLWRQQTVKERYDILYRWYDLIRVHQEDLAVILTSEQGKPIAEARGEIAYAGAFVQWYAEEGKRVYGDTIPAASPDQRIIVIRQPVGVCAAITPWNFPAAMITRKVAPALAAGCTAIVKPASQTPLTALAMAELSRRAGLPAGVLNVITGSATVIGTELTANPIVRKLSFTGSTEVGRKIMAQCADTVKKVSLELGGNAPFIVFDDADVDQAVQGAMISKYRNSGQTCVCANRIFVQDGIYDTFVKKLVAEVEKLKVGIGLEPGVQQGPLIDEAAVVKVSGHIDDALSRGAKLLTGGKAHALGGTFFQPTVLGDVKSDMTVASDETFGPVAPLIRFSSEDEVIRMANDTPYGLAAYFFARDVGLIFRISEALEYGIVGINTGLISTEMAPFGGVKQSGIGREGSRYGMDEYLEMKYLCMAGISR